MKLETKIMKLEETKRKIKELLDKPDFSSFSSGVNINHSKLNIHVWFKRDDTPEREGIEMTIRPRFGQEWTITMNNRSRYRHHVPDEEEMLKFIENKLRELAKGCG